MQSLYKLPKNRKQVIKMGDFVILTDGNNDLTIDLRERFGVEDYFPGIVEFPDGHQEFATLDWEIMTPAEFYGSMNKKHMYQTAMRGVGEVEEFYEKYFSRGLDILMITMSSGLTGTYSTAVTAAGNILKKYPERKIRVIDTLRYSGGAGLLVSCAGDLKKEGKTLEEIAAWLEENRNRVHQIGTVDDLFFLKNMGRISNASAVMGSLISIKPMAEVDSTGMSRVIGKTKGYNNMYKVCLEYMKRTITDAQNSRVFVSCTNRKVQADTLERMIMETIRPKEVIPTTVCITNGVSIGPGMVAAFYLGTPLTPDLSRETRILNDILKTI